MPLSQIIKQQCKVCGAVAKEKSRIDFGDSKLITLECGHLVTEEIIAGADYSSIVSSDGRKLMPYQVTGVQFLEKANGKALLADEQGLGKMVQSAAFIKLHKDTITPAVFATKTTLKLQTMWELFRWVGSDLKVQVVSQGKEIAVPGFDVYVTTYDLMKEDKVWSFIKDDIKTLFLDECQAIKNHLSGRAKAVQKFAKTAEYIIPMSGTPIKNNAGEYFTVLNMIAPRLFPEYNRFIRDWCDSYETQFGYKIGGLSQADRFHELTKDFIIRRTKSEVLPDLPELTRGFHHVELNPKFNAAYGKAMKELEAIYYSEKPEIESMIAIITRMRRITGLSKVTEAVEFVAEHIVSTGRKIVVFVHHHSVADLLEIKLKEYLEPLGYHVPVLLNANLTADKRQEAVKTFETDDKSPVMIASTLAAGEGLNLQFCSDAVMLERQWNPANEEQAEARFHRFGQKNPVTVTYMLASETVDEYFTDIVEQKRAIVASTLDKKEIAWESSSLMRELAEVLMGKGAKRWTL